MYIPEYIKFFFYYLKYPEETKQYIVFLRRYKQYKEGDLLWVSRLGLREGQIRTLKKILEENEDFAIENVEDNLLFLDEFNNVVKFVNKSDDNWKQKFGRYKEDIKKIRQKLYSLRKESKKND